MTAKSYSRLAALIFVVVAALQLIRAVSGWPVNCVIAGVLAWIGFDASR
jgi:hypothetical protein